MLIKRTTKADGDSILIPLFQAVDFLFRCQAEVVWPASLDPSIRQQAELRPVIEGALSRGRRLETPTYCFERHGPLFHQAE